MTKNQDNSKNSPDPQRSAELIGYALGLTDADENQRIESMFEDKARLTEACTRIRHTLSPLDFDAEPVAPRNLTENIMARIDREAGILKFPKSGQPVGDAELVGGGAGPLMPMRELVGLAAAILLFVGILVPGYRTARSAAQQAMCANNLRMIGGGIAGYTEANAASMPFAGAVPVGASWMPSGQEDSGDYSNSRNLFLLVRGRYVSPQAFVDPARPEDYAVPAADLDRLDDFPSARNSSYSANLVTAPWRKSEFEPNMPLVGDHNPMLDDDRRIIHGDQMPQNSRSHGGLDGQNVLRADMSAIWSATPRIGVGNDDIYRVIGVEKYTGHEIPTMRSDAFLVP